MIPVKNNVSEIDHLPGEETAFTIGDPRWVMKTLADLYSNRELAVVREYSTNARDAHIEAGNKNPIQVILPTENNPNFKVKDFGVGLSADELRDVYTKFGTSTKQASNDFNGMLGMGCKSAVAYTNTFTVTAVKDGVRTIAVISRKPDDSIVLKVLAEQSTDLPNGVEISVPVHNANHFATVARDFYRFWEPGTVLVDGVEPEWNVGDKIDDNLYYSTGRMSYVVMGNVPYRIINSDALFYNRGMSVFNFVAYVPNGSMEFSPSREDLVYTEATKKGLAEIVDNFVEKMVTAAKADILTAADHAEALVKYKSWVDKIGSKALSDLKYKGDEFPDNIAISAHRYRKSEAYARYGTYWVNRLEMASIDRLLIVQNFDKVLNSHHKTKAKEFSIAKGLPSTYIYFTKDSFKSPWVADERVVTWDQILAGIPKKPRVQGPAWNAGQTRKKDTFDYWTANGFVTEKELDPKAALFYMTPAQRDSRQGESMQYARALTKFSPSGIIVVLGVNRIDKFKRENPRARDWFDFVSSKFIEDGAALVPAKVKQYANLGARVRSFVTTVDITKVLDPRFAEIKADLAKQEELMKPYNEAREIANLLGLSYRFKQYYNYNYGSDESAFDNYPLLRNRHFSKAEEKDWILYINAKYAGKVI